MDKKYKLIPGTCKTCYFGNEIGVCHLNYTLLPTYLNQLSLKVGDCQKSKTCYIKVSEDAPSSL